MPRRFSARVAGALSKTAGAAHVVTDLPLVLGVAVHLW